MHGFKTGSNRSITVSILFDQLNRKVVRSELDRLNRWSDRQTRWTRLFPPNRPIQLFFPLTVASPFCPLEPTLTLESDWKPTHPPLESRARNPTPFPSPHPVQLLENPTPLNDPPEPPKKVKICSSFYHFLLPDFFLIIFYLISLLYFLYIY